MKALERLKTFGKKYYGYSFIQRFLIFVLLSVFILFVLSFFEYNFWFSSRVRTILFFGYLVSIFSLFAYLLLNPLLQFIRLFFKPSYNNLISLISRYYPELRDLLLNLVYIYDKRYVSVSLDLLDRSIEERTEKLSIYKIEDIVPVRKVILSVFSLTFVVLFLSVFTYYIPRQYIEPVQRIFNYQKDYAQPFPYQVKFLNENLGAPAYTEFELRFKLLGNNIPEEVFLIYQNQMYPVFSKEDVYTHRISVKDRDITFQIQAGRHISQPYVLHVLSKPQFYQSYVYLDFPAYLNKKSERYENVYEFTVPRGTNAKLTLVARHADKLIYNYKDQQIIKTFYHNVATTDFKLFENTTLVFYSKSDQTNLQDSITFSFHVLPDMYPMIEVTQKSDSIEFWRRFFNVRISDDYGLSKLTFHVLLEEDTSFDVPIRVGYIEQEISTFFDFSTFLQGAMGKTINYYFKVCDNDMLFGGKCTKSQTFQLHVPSSRELENINQQISSQITNTLSKQMYQPEVFNNRIDKLIEELLNTKNLDWQQKQKFNKLLEEEQKFQQSIQDVYNQFQQMLNLNNLFSQENAYQNLQKLLEQIKDNNLQQLLEELKKLLDENKNDQLRNNLERLKEENQMLKDMLDQLNQLYKQTYVQENLKNIQNEMKDLSKRQEELSKEKSQNETEKQKAIEQDFKDLLQKMDTVLKFNNEIDNPFNLDSIYQNMRNLEKELENLSRDMNTKSPAQINQKQKKSAEQMDKIANDIEKSMNEQLQEQQAEDEANLIQLLKYLVKISFDQERVFKALNNIRSTDPAYYDVIKQQKLIDDHLQTVTDSLNALARRNPLIDKKIREELYSMQTNRKNTLNFLNQRNIPQVIRNQQFIMMRVNNLALMLAEILKQMQEQNQNNMSSAMKIKTSCKKSGTSSQNKPQPNPSMVRKLQEELNKQIQQLKEQMKNGQPSEKLNEQFARLSLQQEIIRKALQQYQENLKGQGEKNTQQIQKIIEDMEKNEVDLINKQINEQTMFRLQEIMVKLLESEKADMQRELDPNRVSQTAKNINNSNPFTKIEYKELKKQMFEHMKTVPFQFNSFYRQKVGEYYQKYR